MGAAWPFVGREEELARVRRAVVARTAGTVLVCGGVGVGKTRLAAEVVATLDRRRFSPVQVVGTRAGSGIPFGALADVLPEMEATAPSGAVLRRLADALVGAAATDHPVVVVDDAHLLDDSSVALLDLLVRSRRAILLLTLRTGDGRFGHVSGLWKDPSAVRVDLDPLDLDRTATLLELALRGQVEQGCVHRLWRLTQGNPLFLREIVRSGRERGTFRQRFGVWSCVGDLVLPERVSELLADRLSELDEPARRALELVVLGEPITLPMAARLGIEEQVDTLEAQQFVFAQGDGSGLALRPAHPLLGEVVRAGCPPLRRRRRFGELAGALEQTPSSEPDLRRALWLAEAGAAGISGILHRGARSAWEQGAPVAAERLARAALAETLDVGTASLLALLLMQRFQPGEAAAVLAAVDSTQCRDDSERVVLVSARIHVHCEGLYETDEGRRLAAIDAETITDPVLRQDAAIHRASALLVPADAETLLTELAPILAAPAAPHLAVVAQYFAGIAALQRGGTGDALRSFEATRQSLETVLSVWPTLHWHLDMFQTYARILHGQITAGAMASSAAYRSRGEQDDWGLATAMLAFAAGIAARCRGRVRTAATLLREAYAQLGDHAGYFGSVILAELAHCLALQGHAETAETLLAQAEATSPPEPAYRWFAQSIQLARVRVQAVRTDAAAAVAVARAAADRARDLRLPGFELLALHEQTRLGGPADAAVAAERLENVAHDGPLVLAIRAHARALAQRDPAALLSAADALSGLGADLAAADAAAQAAVMFGRDSRAAAGAAARAAVLAEACEGAVTPALTTLATPRLTSREREIATLAAQGLTSRQIADRLVLSARTVDNHLGSVYAKLGVTTRADLAHRMASSSGTPTAPMRGPRHDA